MVGEWRQRPVAAGNGELAHLQVNVARTLFHGTPKDRIQLHALDIGSDVGSLEDTPADLRQWRKASRRELAPFAPKSSSHQPRRHPSKRGLTRARREPT